MYSLQLYDSSLREMVLYFGGTTVMGTRSCSSKVYLEMEILETKRNEMTCEIRRWVVFSVCRVVLTGRPA